MTTPARMPTRTDLPAADLSPYAEANVRFARDAWPLRAAEELRSALIFRGLTHAARVAKIPEPWPSRFASAVRDEMRHARLCATVGARLGARAPAYDARPVRARLARLTSPRWRVASILLAELAIGETISMLLFRATCRAAREPLTRAALSAILADEARHQRLGWTALADLWPSLTEDERNDLQHEAARALASCERSTAVPAMQWLKSGRRFEPEYAALGVLDPAIRVETFYTAVERFVVPRLTRLGLEGARAWASRYAEGARPAPRS